VSENLFVRLGESTDRVEAAILSAEGRLLRSPAVIPLSGAAALAEGRRVSVIVPSDQAVVLGAEIPRTSAAKTRSLLPFSLEDHFATDIEELHFAVGAPLPDGRITAAAVERVQLDRWLTMLAESGIRPQAVYPACDGMPAIPSTTTLLLDAGSVLGRRPEEPPFDVPGLGIDDVFALLGSDDPAQADLRHVMVYGSAAELEAQADGLDSLRRRVPDVDVRELRDAALPLLAATLIARGGTNLLQGEYAPKSNIRAALRPWRTAAAVAAGIAALWIFGAGIDYLKLRSADSALTERTVEICSRDFGTAVESACRAEAQRRLTSIGQSSSSGDASFLAALSVVADAVDSAELEALSYRNRTLDLDMIVSDVTALDEFSRAVGNSREFEARALSNTPQDGGLRSRVQVIVAE
jgi:general secretion pathway protein L